MSQKNWSYKTLGEIIKFNPSEKIEKNSIAKKIPMDKLKEFQRNLEGFEFSCYKGAPKFRNGDTLLAKITPCLENGKTAQVNILEENEVGFGSSEFIVLRENEHSINDFIYYLARSPLFRKKAISCMDGTSGRKRVNETALKSLEILFPEKPIQIDIVKVLSSLDDKIELNNKINTELESLAKTIYDYWFVQFDFPNEKGKPYRASGGKMVYNEELKRDIPVGWEVTPIADWIEENKTGDWGKDESQGIYSQKVYCIRGADLNALNGKGTLKTPIRYISEKNKHKILHSHDIIVEISGGSPTQSTGRITFLIDETLKRFDSPVINSNFCKAISLKYPKQLFNFVYEWRRLYDAGVLFGYEGKTSGLKNLLFESFINSYYITTPPETLSDKFYDIIAPIQAKIQTNLLENQQLAELRDWLLPLLMNGQVTVKDTKTVDFKIESQKIIDREQKLAMMVKQFSNRLKIGYGEVVIQKTSFNLNAFANYDLEYKFVASNHGTYSAELKKDLSTNKYLTKQSIHGKEIFALNEKSEAKISSLMTTEEAKPYLDALNLVLDLYEKPEIHKEKDKIELLNSIAKVILDSQTTDLDTIYSELKKWKINQKPYKTKAEKFSKADTDKMLKMIIKEKLHLKIMKDIC